MICNRYMQLNGGADQAAVGKFIPDMAMSTAPMWKLI
jgi:hypothetical protein